MSSARATITTCVGVVGSPATSPGWQVVDRDRLSPYKLPRSPHVVATLPGNAMGRVTKPAVVAMLPRP